MKSIIKNFRKLLQLGFSVQSVFIFIISSASHIYAQERYNVLVITLDDMNDWVGCLGGNHQTKTPNIDKLASQSVIFSNAQCPYPLCNPSRVSFLTGFMPATSMVFTNLDTFRTFPVLKNSITLPQYFKQNGYNSISIGKVFQVGTGILADTQSWSLFGYAPGYLGTVPSIPGYTPNGIPVNLVYENFWWGSTPDSIFNNTPDYNKAKWVKSQLNLNQPKPFFLAWGILTPHLPWIVPKMFFDKFPLNSIILPNIDTNDLADIGGFYPSAEYKAVKKYGLQKSAVQGYLAAISYVDSCVGIVIDALNKSAYANNTIVVLIGDNGFHMGEKLRYEKYTLWEESARVPLLIRLPGFASGGAIVNTPVSLCDIYPTLTELCNLPQNTNNEGESLVPFFANPQLVSDRVALTTNIYGHDTLISAAIRSLNWRYIVRPNNQLELYDHINDSMEFINLASNVLYDSIRNDLATKLEKSLNKKSSTRLAVRTNNIPGIIQAEKYDMGGEGIAYHDQDIVNYGGYYRIKDGVDIKPCLDIGGGLQVDSIVKDEWLGYTINQIDSGAYKVKFRVSSNDATIKYIKVYIGGNLVIQKYFYNTSNEWVNITSNIFNLQKKSNAKLKLLFKGTGFRINYFEFTRVPSDINQEGLMINDSLFFEVKPNPVRNESEINFVIPMKAIADLYISNLLGIRVCTLLKDQIEAGDHSILFNPSQYNLPQGFYLCTLDINNHQYSTSKRIQVID